MKKTTQKDDIDFDYKYGFSMPDTSVFQTKRGISPEVVFQISKIKNEPDWMTQKRLKAYEIFLEKKMPPWGADLSKIDFDDIVYFIRATDKQKTSWEDLPAEIKDTYDRIGVPEAEKKFLSGVSAQYESEVVYESVNKELTKQGVLFCDMDTAVVKYPEIVKEYFGTLIPARDNKFSALNTAVWSGGSFVYVPKGVHVNLPLQAYFRINAERFGQFERTLIIADEGSSVHYIEGCLPVGELISTGDDWKRVETIQPGDFVATHTGNLSRVSKVMTRHYKGKLHTIVPLSPGNAFSLTSEHPVLAIKRDSVLVKRKPRNGWKPETDTLEVLKAKPEYIKVSELVEGDFVIFPKVNGNLIGQSELNADLVELLGFYTAEGSAHYHKTLKQYIVSLSFSDREVPFVERVAELIEKVTGKKAIVNHVKSKHELRVMVYSKPLHDLCNKHCGKYAHLKKLSGELMNQSNELLWVFFEAYFKGDGNLSIREKYKSKLYRASTASKDLAIQLQEILARVGIFASIRFRKGGPDTILGRSIIRKDQYILSYTAPKGWSEVRQTENYFIVPIKKIVISNYDDEVFNMEVENAQSYLVKGFAVHNCTAPIYTTDSLHSAVVEIFVKKNARVRYTTVQNWSNNVYNLVTKRASADENAIMEWIDCNIGSKVTMKYPSVYLKGEGARGEVLSIAYAGKGQHQDAGAKMFHFAPNTSSRIVSKSISKNGGRTSYRGLVQIQPNATNSSVYVSCDALLMDEDSRSDTYPTMKIMENDVQVQHEATVEKLGEEKLFYLTSRGISKNDAEGILVNGFIEPVTREIPLEYSIELNRLMQLEMSGSVG